MAGAAGQELLKSALLPAERYMVLQSTMDLSKFRIVSLRLGFLQC